MALNLLESEKEKKPLAFRALGITIIITTALSVGLLFISFFSYKQFLNIRIKNWQNQVENLKKQEAEKSELERQMLVFQKQLEQFSALKSQTPYYSVFFDSLEKALLTNLSLKGITVTFQDKKIELTGFTNSLDSLGFLIASLREAPVYSSSGNPVLENGKEVKMFQGVDLKTTSLNFENQKILYKFEITLTPSPKAFVKIRETSPNNSSGASVQENNNSEIPPQENF